MLKILIRIYLALAFIVAATIVPGSATAQVWLMSTLGHKRTLFTNPFHVCFTPESGHYSALHQMSAERHKLTSGISAL